MKYHLLKSLAILILVITVVVSVQAVNAQEQVRTFTISPPTIQVELAPGEKTEGVIKLSNDGSTSLNFLNSIRDFIVEDNLGTPKILPINELSNKYSGASWIGIYPDQIYVSPHQKSEISYYIQVPINARPGGHYAAVVYTPTTTVGGEQTGAAVNTSIGSLFYITVKGPVNQAATVTKFVANWLFEASPVTVRAQVKNLSDIHIKPAGSITLKNMLGGTSDVRKLPEYNIFPGVSRDYEVEAGKGFMLGLYKATLNATYGTDNKTLVATTSFIVFPWKAAAFLVLLIAVLLVGYRYWKKEKKTHRSEENQPPANNI